MGDEDAFFHFSERDDLREQKFRCRSCKKEFTKVYIFENEHLVLRTKCPNCSSNDLQALDQTSEKLQVEFAEKVKRINENKGRSPRNRPM